MTKEKNEETPKRMFIASISPHIRGHGSVKGIMWIVVIALLIPFAGAVYYFGIYVIFVALTAIVTGILVEYCAKVLRKREFVLDGSTFITGLLLAMVLPPRIPLWAVAIGAAIAIGIAKEAFGGLGQNIFNPALVGRAFLTASFAGLMTKWVAPVKSLTADTISTATPLSENFVFEGTKSELYMELLMGNVGGSIGETSALLILIGGILLLILGIINWRIPLFYIGTVFALTWILGRDPVFHILAGGLLLGAFFMATDYVTAPLTHKGKIIFAVGAGVVMVSIREYGGMSEGVAFSILIMNGFTPLIDRYTVPKPYGFQKEEKKKEEKKEDKVKKKEGKEEPVEKKEEKVEPVEKKERKGDL